MSKFYTIWLYWREIEFLPRGFTIFSNSFISYLKPKIQNNSRFITFFSFYVISKTAFLFYSYSLVYTCSEIYEMKWITCNVLSVNSFDKSPSPNLYLHTLIMNKNYVWKTHTFSKYSERFISEIHLEYPAEKLSQIRFLFVA